MDTMHSYELVFNNDRELYMAYMPFLKKGGLFIRTNDQLELGESVTLKVTLPGQIEPTIMETAVCWITPQGAQNGTEAGLGVAFDKDEKNIRNQIETALGRMLNSKDPTYTM